MSSTTGGTIYFFIFILAINCSRGTINSFPALFCLSVLTAFAPSMLWKALRFLRMHVFFSGFFLYPPWLSLAFTSRSCSSFAVTALRRRFSFPFYYSLSTKSSLLFSIICICSSLTNSLISFMLPYSANFSTCTSLSFMVGILPILTIVLLRSWCIFLSF